LNNKIECISMSNKNRKGFKPLAPLSPKIGMLIHPPKIIRDDVMKRLLLVLVIIAVAISGCTEKGPSETGGASGIDRSVDDLKTLSISAAEELTSYSVKSSMSQIWTLYGDMEKADPENVTTVTESVETIASVNLSSFQAQADGSTENQMVQPGQPASPESSRTTQVVVYQLGNSTYIKDESGNWTHLQDPRSAEDIWGQDNNNQVKAMAEMFNQSTTEEAGSDTVEGQDTYKFKIVTGSGDYDNLYNTASSIAAQLTQYPMFMPAVNKTELNETSKMEKTIWISKTTYLPVKYESLISFQMTPEIIGELDLNTSQMKMYNQSRRLPPVSISMETSDLYYDFDKPVVLTLPAEALSANTIRPTTIQPQMAGQA
jgi:outer membrane lipoprotein-sorting protein